MTESQYKNDPSEITLEALEVLFDEQIAGGPSGGFGFYYCRRCNRESVTLDKMTVNHKPSCNIGKAGAAIIVARAAQGRLK